MERLKNKTQVVILQHPQEPDRELGTASLTCQSLGRCVLKVGLSWPNLTRVLGRQASPSKFLVLHLGTGAQGYQLKKSEIEAEPKPELYLIRKKEKTATQYRPPNGTQESIQWEGLILLDGTWSQAKTLWWRNAWLLKCQRAFLKPARPSLYGKLRKEPRPECLSTIEAVGAALTALGEDPGIESQLLDQFSHHLARFK